MKKALFITLLLTFFCHMSKAQVIASIAPDNRISVITQPYINFSADEIAIYSHSYYLEGGNWANSYESYNWRQSLVTNGSGWYAIHTFVFIYRRLVDGSLIQVGRKKYYTRIKL